MINRKYGFTLVEILLAMLIFSVIGSSLYMGIKVGLEASERGRRNFQVFQELRIYNKELARDLRGIFSISLEELELETFEGGAEFLSFVSYKPGGLYKISYYKEEENYLRSVEKIYFSTEENEETENSKEIKLAEPKIYHLASGFKKIEFEYLDAENNWQAEWTIEKEYPSVLRASFYFQTDEEANYKIENIFSVPLGRKVFAEKLSSE